MLLGGVAKYMAMLLLPRLIYNVTVIPLKIPAMKTYSEMCEER